MTDESENVPRWRPLVAILITLTALTLAVVLLADALGCFGCGGLTFAPGTSPAEQVAAMSRVRRLTVTAVVTTVAFVALVSVGRLAWRVRR